MDILGILTGFMAALFQSFSYLGSRWFFARSTGTPMTLISISLVWMGLASLAVFPLFVSLPLPPARTVVFPVLGTVLFYVIGQIGLFIALKAMDSSRIAPLLGLKIFVLAVVTALFFHSPLGVWQWASVALSVIAVFTLNEKGGRLSAMAFAGLSIVIMGYSCSDLFIKQMMKALAPMGKEAALTGLCLTYIAGLVIGLPLAFRKEARQPRLWIMGIPYAFCWFVSMYFLYICFDRIGVVFGNIIQSTRGLMSIGLGYMVARWLGMADLEQRIPHRVFFRRLMGAALMTAAIVLYLKSSGPRP